MWTNFTPQTFDVFSMYNLVVVLLHCQRVDSFLTCWKVTSRLPAVRGFICSFVPPVFIHLFIYLFVGLCSIFTWEINTWVLQNASALQRYWKYSHRRLSFSTHLTRDCPSKKYRLQPKAKNKVFTPKQLKGFVLYRQLRSEWCYQKTRQ